MWPWHIVFLRHRSNKQTEVIKIKTSIYPISYVWANSVVFAKVLKWLRVKKYFVTIGAIYVTNKHCSMSADCLITVTVMAVHQHQHLHFFREKKFQRILFYKFLIIPKKIFLITIVFTLIQAFAYCLLEMGR